MTMTDALRKAQKKYVQEKTVTVQLRFRIEQDKDLIRQLDQVPCKTEYLKELIRQDIRRTGGK